jgi:nitrate/nitrite transporter NarK
VRHFGAAFRDARVLILGGIQFGFLVGSYGIGIFLPQILDTGRLSTLQIGFVTSACYAVASLTMVVWASYVDRHENRVGNLALACLVAAVGFAASIVVRENLWLSIAALTVAVSGVNAARALFWTIPPRFLTGMAAAGGLAFINSIGTSGGFVGPYVMGWLADRTGSFAAGQLALTAFLLAASGLAWWLKSFEAE